MKLNRRTLDRTSELRKKGFKGRRLGPVQMTTDTAVRVTRMVVEEQCKSSALFLFFSASHLPPKHTRGFNTRQINWILKE